MCLRKIRSVRKEVGKLERDLEKLFFEAYDISPVIERYRCGTITGFCENPDLCCRDCGLSTRIDNKRLLTPENLLNLISLFGKDQYYFQICQSDFGKVQTSISWIDFDKMKRVIRIGVGKDLKESLLELFTDYTIKKIFYEKVRTELMCR